MLLALLRDDAVLSGERIAPLTLCSCYPQVFHSLLTVHFLRRFPIASATAARKVQHAPKWIALFSFGEYHFGCGRHLSRARSRL